MTSDFVHLRFHSEYSLMDSCCLIKSVKKESLKRGFNSLAITDTTSIAGIIRFYKECIKTEDADGNKLEIVKPILGSLFYLSDNSISDKENTNYDPIILLSKDNVGFENLKKLSHISQTDGFNETDNKPRIDMELLGKYHEGLILIATDLNGPIQKYLRRKKIEDAKKIAFKFKDIFSEDMYLEVQKNGQTDQDFVNAGIVSLGDSMGTKIVATNDVRYYDRKHHLAHLVLQALDERKTVKSKKFSALRTDERYYKTFDEMKEAFKDYPIEVLTNTMEVAEKCNVVLKFGGMRLPEIQLPEGFKTDWEYLRYLAFDGLKRRGLEDKKEYVDRLEEELFDVYMVNETKGYNFARYFLMVWDYANHAQDHGCRIGSGRGSACGSLLLYVLRVTGVDPIKYDLYWWRFLTVDKRDYIDENCFI